LAIEKYGYTSFGQSLLLGRRLVEADTPYVQVNWSLGVDSVDKGRPVKKLERRRISFAISL
jgi:hypothetical protein